MINDFDGKFITKINFSNLKEKIFKNNCYNLISNECLDKFSFEELRMFCHFFGRYFLPTIESVEILKKLIEGKHAIEIGSGCGDLARFLNITATDNYCMEIPEVKAFYEATKQPVTKYGSNVEKIDALDAVKKYKPDIVIGAWVNQWIDPYYPPPSGGGSIYGVKEEEILDLINTYILIGSEKIHGTKKIMKYRHVEIDGNYFRSRRQDNKVWIWDKKYT